MTLRYLPTFWTTSILLLLSLEVSAQQIPLIEALQAESSPLVRQLVLEGADPNSATADGTTALHWAVLQNNVDITRLLIAQGANEMAENRLGVTPLHLAATNGNATIFE